MGELFPEERVFSTVKEAVATYKSRFDGQ